MADLGEFQFVTPQGDGLVAKGKGPPNVIKLITRALSRQGVQSEALTSDALIARGPAQHKNAHVVLHYNELVYSKHNNHAPLREIEQRLVALGFTVHHTTDSALVIADKRRQNIELSAAGVLMPSLIQGKSADLQAFSNEAVNAHVPVAILPPGTQMDESRYNTEYINTVHASCGDEYYTSVRCLCFGKNILASWVRTSATSTGNPNVRSRTTEPNAAVLNDLHARLVTGNRRQLRRIAANVANRLGTNFYAHDLLPCAKTGKLYLCETNFKFYEGMYRWKMMPIRDEHPAKVIFDGRKFARQTSRTIIAELFSD